MRRKIPVEIARKLADAEHMLVEVSLAVTGHDELWGALRAAKAAASECRIIAIRDLDRTTIPAPPAKRSRTR